MNLFSPVLPKSVRYVRRDFALQFYHCLTFIIRTVNFSVHYILCKYNVLYFFVNFVDISVSNSINAIYLQYVLSIPLIIILNKILNKIFLNKACKKKISNPTRSLFRKKRSWKRDGGWNLCIFPPRSWAGGRIFSHSYFYSNSARSLCIHFRHRRANYRVPTTATLTYLRALWRRNLYDGRCTLYKTRDAASVTAAIQRQSSPGFPNVAPFHRLYNL